MSIPTAKLKSHGDTMRGALTWSGTDYAGLTIQSLTTTQRDALSPANGALIYNTTDAQLQRREAGAWLAFTAGLEGVRKASDDRQCYAQRRTNDRRRVDIRIARPSKKPDSGRR